MSFSTLIPRSVGLCVVFYTNQQNNDVVLHINAVLLLSAQFMVFQQSNVELHFHLITVV